MAEIAIVSITKHGLALGRRLHAALPESALLVSKKLLSESEPGVIPLEGALKDEVARFFHEYKQIVFLVSLGAVVRLIAPHLKDKHVDPGVLVVDDRAQFVISVLSGHVGGANAFTERLAQALDATPVITTASDVGKTIPVDILGRELGWTLEHEANVTRVSAAVVNEEPIAFIQETGEKTWWTRDVPLPPQIKRFSSLEELGGTVFGAYLIVSDRVLDLPPSVAARCVTYRPKSLVLGMGCDRGASFEEVEGLVKDTLGQHDLALASVKAVATIEQKRDEPALLQLCKTYGLELKVYTKDELSNVQAVENPSETVRKWVGVPSVSEAASLVYARAERLLVPKVKSVKATLAISRIVFPDRQGETR